MILSTSYQRYVIVIKILTKICDCYSMNACVGRHVYQMHEPIHCRNHIFVVVVTTTTLHYLYSRSHDKMQN